MLLRHERGRCRAKMAPKQRPTIGHSQRPRVDSALARVVVAPKDFTDARARVLLRSAMLP
jgi:hypothetical protein